MKVILVIYIIYESTFLKTAHSSLEIVPFQTMKECYQWRSVVKDVVQANTKRFDSIVAVCREKKKPQ